SKTSSTLSAHCGKQVSRFCSSSRWPTKRSLLPTTLTCWKPAGSHITAEVRTCSTIRRFARPIWEPTRHPTNSHRKETQRYDIAEGVCLHRRPHRKERLVHRSWTGLVRLHCRG